MHPDSALERHGGTARRAQLLCLCERADLDRLVRSGDILRDARGRYSLARTEQALRTANRLTGVLSHTSAALHWGWAVKTTPTEPHVTFRRKRRLTAEQRAGIAVHYADLDVDDVRDEHVTTRRRTLHDCLRQLPFDEALTIADSALREGDFSRSGLATVAALVRGPGAPQARRVAELADGRAANPFESVLRALVLEVPELDVEPQTVISGPGFWGRHDLVDAHLRLVLEADSHTWHSSRAAVRRDCRRYNRLVVNGWTVLRFAWEDVMFEPEVVRQTLLDVLPTLTPRQRTGRLVS